jgi:hypothetical protein
LNEVRGLFLDQQPRTERNMDLKNNQCGLTRSRMASSPLDCQQACQAAVGNGSLITAPTINGAPSYWPILPDRPPK